MSGPAPDLIDPGAGVALRRTAVRRWQPWQPWLVAGIGLLAMYLPTLVFLARHIWTQEGQGHGPVVLGLALWLFGRQLPDLVRTEPRLHDTGWGWPLLALGCLALALGRSQGVLALEVGSLTLVLGACALLLSGRRGLRRLWFALVFLLFVIPLPLFIVDALTQPMKLAVSLAVEQLLFWAGYPVARSGVILQIGPYQLMVADACAGLRTLFTLEALGLLYLNLVQHASPLRNLTLAALIVPVSFAANVIRVASLVLITWYFGDEAGQGFLHGFAGLVLFGAALGLIVMLDSGLRLLDGRLARSRSPA